MAKTEALIRLDGIRIDPAIQSREGLDEQKVEEYAEAMRQGESFPPINLFSDEDGALWLGGGFHRAAAAQRVGKTMLQALLETGGRRAAILHSAGANTTHGLPRSNADKRRAVLLLLEDAEWRQWSDREIGRRCHVNHETVGKIRGEYLAKSPDSSGEPETRKVRRGDQEYEQTLKNPTRHAAPTEESPERPAPFAPPPEDDDEGEIERGFDEQDEEEEPLVWSREEEEEAPAAPAAEPQQMSLLGVETVPVSTALAESYGPAKPAGPAYVFQTETDFLKAARALSAKDQKEQSDNDEWITPDELLDALRAEGWRFTLDVAATEANAKALRYFTKENSALIQSWEQRPDLGDDGDGWMNHPYTLTPDFMAKAFQTAMDGLRSMACLPKNDTEQRWWWDYARFGQVRILPRRISFSGAKGSGRFGNVLVIFPKDMAKPGYKPSVTHWDWRGDINAELPLAASPALKSGGVLLGDRAFFKQPVNFDQPDAPLIWTPYRAPEKGTRKAG